MRTVPGESGRRALAGLVAAAGLLAAARPARPATPTPMKVPVENSARARWLVKPVLASRLLDDMEDANTWTHFGPGAMRFTAERCRSGKRSVRLESPTKLPKPNPTRGRPFGEAGLRRRFDGADWRAFNRLSVWVYPEMKGHRRGSVLLKLTEAGPKQALGPWVRGAMNHVLVTPGRWNHVVWEIAHLPREKVTALDLIYRLQGSEPGSAAAVRIDFDRLELQKVHADHFAGWNVAPGRIAFCHTGYVTGSPKTALASGLAGARFSLVSRPSGKAVLTRPVRTVKTRLGEFQVLDFSEIDAPGEYVLRAGDAVTRAFRIAPDVWRRTIGKSVNFFTCLRCGAAVPGLHGVCHADLTAEHAGRRIVTNGGWHDAGDLSQGEINTAEGVYAMLRLAERLGGRDAELRGRLLDEAVWGLRWLLKTRFGDGHRVMWQTMDFWTDNRPGGADDVQARVEDSAYGNFIGCRAEAVAARALKASHPERAREALAAAREDWQFALRKASKPGVELAGEAVLAGVELFRATGERTYADKAVELARTVLACQQTTWPRWDVPLVGFFYKAPAKRSILNFFHRGHDQAPVVALAALCEALPDHADWPAWYAAVTLHSEYQRAAAACNEPYRTLPAGIYPLRQNPKEVALGVRLAETHFLRRFPVIGDWRGHFGVLLSQTKALAAAARLRGDAGLADLCQAQLQWVIGRNPFCQSTMYGEGYDFAPQYTPMCGDIVGSLPVGIQYRGGTDEPYWPASNCWVFKEVWVHSSSRWIWILSDLAGGRPRPGVSKACVFSAVQQTRPDGSVIVRVSARGRGRHRFAVRAWNLHVADARKEADLQAGRAAELTWTAKVQSADSPWVAVVVADGNAADRRELLDPKLTRARGKLAGLK